MTRRSIFGKHPRRKHSRRQETRRLFIESLEERRVLAVYSAIVDNVDTTNFSTTGSWGSQPSGFGGTILVGAAGSNANATWSFNVTPGTYRLAATWQMGHATHSPNVPLQIFNGTTQIGSPSLNQSLNADDFVDSGSGWKNVGTFTVGSVLRVTMVAGASGFTIADAFRIEKVSASVFYVDNADSANFTKSGNWVAQGGSGYGGSILTGSSGSTASWTFNVEPGTYRLAATWHVGHQSYSPNVQLQIFNGTTQIGSSTLNQTLSADDLVDGGAGWKSVGTYTVGSVLRVTMSAGATGTTIADAFRLEKVATTVLYVDDSDTVNFAKTGSWSIQSGNGYGGSISVGAAGNTASWSFNVEPGTYRLAATWHLGHQSHSPNALLQIFNGATQIGASSLNQTLGADDFADSGSGWENVGTFTVNSVLRVNMLAGTGSTIADAFRLEKVLTSVLYVDNKDVVNFSKIGNWGDQSGGYGGTISVATAGNNTLATWVFDVEPGTYKLAATWHLGHEQHSPNVPLRIYNGATQIGAPSLNQRLNADDFLENGLGWENLGTFTVNTTFRVVMSAGEVGYSIADAFRIEKAPTTVQYVDNLDPVNFAKIGSWGGQSATTYGGSIFVATAGNNTLANWVFNVEPGTYRIAATWHVGHSSHSTNVPLRIFSGATQVGTSSLNQSLYANDFVDAGSGWKDLGTFSVKSALRVVMSAADSGYTIADAFRIEKVLNTVQYVDNSNSTNFSKAGTWSDQTGAGYGSTISVGVPGNSTLASWVFNVEPGSYKLSATWHMGHLQHSTNVPIRVYNGTTQIGSSSLDQSLFASDFTEGGAGWKNIGIFTVSSTLRVTMSAGLVGYAIADALRIEPLIASGPIAHDDTNFYTPTGGDLTVTATSPTNLLANDSRLDGTAMWSKIASYPTNGTLLAFGADGTFTYRPNSGFTGVDSFTYRTSNGVLESLPARVSIAVGTRLLGRQNLDSNVLNPWSADPWLATSLLDATNPSEGFGQGFSNIPNGSSQSTEGGIATTGGLQLVEDLAPNTAIVYRSNSLTKPIVSVITQLAPGVAVPTSVTARLIFGGLSGPVYTYSSADLSSGLPVRFAMQADGTLLATGMYDFTIEVTTTINGIAQTQSFSGKQAIVNRTASEFGNGWGLDGLDRLFDSASGALIVRGNGDSFWFPKVGAAYQHALGDTSYSSFLKNGNQTFTLTSKTGIVSSFSDRGLLTSRSDANGNTYTFAYVDRNNDLVPAELTSVTDPFGRITNFNYTNDKVSSIAHYSGKTTTLAYASGNLTSYSLTDPDGSGPLTSPTIFFGYDSPNLVTRKNAVNEVTKYEYDGNDGRLFSVLTPDNASWKIKPAERIGLPAIASVNALKTANEIQATVTDQRLNPWRFRTDRFGGITESITALGFVRTAKRNADGLAYVITEPDPDGSGRLSAPVTTLGYNGFADLTYLVAPDQGITRMLYSANLHRPTSVADPVGRTQNFFYNATGNMVTSVDGAGFASTMTYNSRGLPTSFSSPDPDGSGPLLPSVNSISYDSFGRPISITNPDGSSQTFSYNTADQLLSTSDELVKTSSFTYDLLGRAITSTNRVNASNSYQYDSLSRVVKQIDPRQKVTEVFYSNRGWLDRVIYPDPDDNGPLTSAIDFRSYDSVGNLTSQSDPRSGFQGKIPYPLYDADNRLRSIGHPEFLDANGNPTVTEGRKYDNIGRLTNIDRVQSDSTSSNPSVASEVVQIDYDDLGRIKKRITRSSTAGEELFSESYNYNLAGELISTVDSLGNESTNVYDKRGLITFETMPDPDGDGPLFPVPVIHTYDNKGREISVDRGFGRVTKIEYNSRDWVTKVTQPDPDLTGPLLSPITTIEYDVRGDIRKLTDPMARATQYSYDDEQRLVQRTDPDPDGTGVLTSPITTWAYNANNWMTSTTNPVGATSTFQYDALGRVNLATSPDPDDAGPLTSPTTSYVYSMKGLSTVIDPLSRATSFDRDLRGRVKAMTDTSGEITEYAYDFYDRVVKQTAPDPDGVGPLLRSVQSTTYDLQGRLSTQTDDRGTTTYTYDTSSNLKFVDDANLNRTEFKYDAWNRVKQEINAPGKSRTNIYDAAGNLTRTIDRNNKVVSYVYDALDRPTQENWQATNIVTPTLTVSTIQESYRADEQQAVGWNAPTNATNMSGTFTITAVNQTTGALPWNASAATIQAALEALPSIGFGNISVSVTSPTTYGRTINLNFKNAKGAQNIPQSSITTNLVATPAGNGSAWVQTIVEGISRPEKQVLQLPGVNGGTWRVAYGDEISGPLPNAITSQDLERTLNDFVGIDNVSVVGGASQFTVTFGGTQSNIDMAPIRADGGNLNAGTPLRTISTAYNSNSEVVSVSDPSSTINYSRDNLGRVTTIANTYSSAVANTSFTQSFDAIGNRTELRAAIGANLDFKNSYTYDKLQRLTDIVQAGQAGGNAVAAKHVAFNYNTLSQLTKISRYQSTGTANPVATTDFTFDTANRLSGISHKQGSTDLNTYAYTYDRMSRLSTVNSTAEGLNSYSYDQVSQLIGATNTFGNDETYDYDKNGNRKTGYTVDTDNKTMSSPAAPSTPAYNYLYDDEGNITRRQNAATLASTYYEYDHRNRLVSVSGQQSRIDYQYDAYNRLVSRSNVASTIFWSYDTGINPVLEFDISQSPALTHRYLWSNSVDELLADEKVTSTSSAGNTLWGLADHLGTIRDIADANEATGVTSVVNHRRYNAFGKLMSQTGAVDIIFGYTGKYSDIATGLQNNLNRWYDPNLGKWISQDPIGFAAGDANLYRYTGNSPTNRTDPSGLDWDWAWNWHHLLPKQVFENLKIAGVDINSKEYGFMLRAIDHIGEGPSVHNLGWNAKWQAWVAKEIGEGRELTKQSVDKHLKTMIKDFDLKNKGFAAKYGYEMAEKAYKAAERMWRAGRPVASRAISKVAEEATEKVKVPRMKGRFVGRGVGIVGSLLGSWALGGDPVNDSIDGLILTSTMGDSMPDLDMSEYRPWDDYQHELDAMQAERDAYDEYINNYPSPPDDYYGPFVPERRIR